MSEQFDLNYRPDTYWPDALDEEQRRYWGALHPHCMGGEYLPELEPGDVEIARISLASVTSDQISIRAPHAGDRIRYAVRDEYDTDFELAFSESERPLTLGEFIALIDGSGYELERLWGGLLVCHFERRDRIEYRSCEDVAAAIERMEARQ